MSFRKFWVKVENFVKLGTKVTNTYWNKQSKHFFLCELKNWG